MNLCYDTTKKESGAILIISLWILTILSLFAVGLGHQLSIEIHILHNQLDSVKASYIAEAGVEMAIAQKARALEAKDPSMVDHVGQPWFNNEEIFKNVKLGEGAYTVENQQVVGLYGMSDEQSKININKVPFDTVKALLKQKIDSDEEASNLAAAIIDWRDDDNQIYKDSTGALIGAEDEYYQARNPPYHCKNSDFDAMEEILLVRGMMPEIFYGKDLNGSGIIEPGEEGIKDYVAVYGDGPVNMNTTSKIVLAAVLDDQQLTEYIDNSKKPSADGKGGKWFVDTDQPITENAAMIINIHNDIPDSALGNDEGGLWGKLKTAEQQTKSISVTSSIFRIKSTGTVRDIQKTVEAVVEFDIDGKNVFRYWRSE